MVDAAQAADILVDARLNNIQLDDIPDACKARTWDEGLEVEAAILRHPALEHAGWKVALTNKALQEQWGLTEPVCGPLYKQFIHDSGHVFEAGAACLGGIETEFAVTLNKDLPASGAPYTVEQVAEAVATMHPALEVTGCRFRTRAELGRPGSTQDFASNLAFVFGKGVSDWRKFDLPNHAVKHIVDGDIIKESTGAFVLDHPLNPLAWLANKLATRGLSLKAGQQISTGAATGPIPIDPGQTATGDFGDLGTVSCKMPTK